MTISAKQYIKDAINTVCGFNVENKEEQLKIIMNKKDGGGCIAVIHNPDKEVQLAAVRNCGLSIGFINNPDKEVQMESIRKEPMTISMIHSPHKEVQMEAIKKSGYNPEVIALCPDWEEWEEEIYNHLVCKDIIE
jgi:hypothetical protein